MAESSTSTTPKKIPTVAKVNEMISAELNNIMSSNLDNIPKEKTKYIAQKWTSGNSGTYGVGTIDSTDGTLYNCEWSYVSNTYVVNIKSYGSNKPNMQLRDGDNILGEYEGSGSMTTLTNSAGKERYYWNLTFNFENIIFTDNTIDNNNIKLYVYQYDKYRQVINIPFEKQSYYDKIEPDDCIMTFYAFRNRIYPIGSVYISTKATDPGIFIGGTWEIISSLSSDVYIWKRTA